MPTKLSEYHCGHVKSTKGIPFEMLSADQVESHFDPHFSFQRSPQRQSSERYTFPTYRHPSTSAAVTLENLDREAHARIAGLPSLPIIRRQSRHLNTRIHSPSSTSTMTPRRSIYRRESKIGEVLFSSRNAESQRGRRKNSETKRGKKFYMGYPCRDCRFRSARKEELQRSDEIERQLREAEMSRLFGSRGTGGNRYRGDEWYEGYERGMREGGGLRVRAEERR